MTTGEKWAQRLRSAPPEKFGALVFVKRSDMEWIEAAEGQVQALSRLKAVFQTPGRTLGVVHVLAEQYP